MFKIIMGLIATVVFTACQTKPTTVRETQTRSFGGSQALLGPIVIDETVIVADARNSFDFSMARIPRSVSINWTDYSEAEPNKRGWPQKDLFAAARRLARLGIATRSKVVVLGNGVQGQGEEGRVAWTLAYLGIDNVRFGRFGAVQAKLTTEALPEAARSAFEDGRSLQPPESPNETKPIWKPVIVDSLIVSHAELMTAIAKPQIYRIIDVRSEAEYLGKAGGMRAKAIPNLNALNVPWKEFFDADFRPAAETAARLASVGLSTNQRIIVIDNDGVASAAVTMALRAFGYSEAGLFAGGYNDLMSR